MEVDRRERGDDGSQPGWTAWRDRSLRLLGRDRSGCQRARPVRAAGDLPGRHGRAAEEAFGADWPNVDLEGRVFKIGHAFAKGRLKPEPKTEGSRRRVPLRRRVVDALQSLPRRRGILLPASLGGRIIIDNWRTREWVPALEAAGVRHRRIYDLRHTYATWSLAAGINIFTLARRMGTSVQMIDRTYGHLAANADDYERDLLDAFDDEHQSDNGRSVGADDDELADEVQ